VPYFGYARQDKRFNLGEAMSAKVMAQHISLGTDKVVTVDLHNLDTLDDFNSKAINISGMTEIARYFRRNFEIDAIVSPDKGSIHRAKMVAEELEKPFDYLEKVRIDGQTVKISPKNMDIKGKNVAIVDDIIATGGTIVTAAAQLKENGAEKVYAACTHGLYTNKALSRLEPVLDCVLSTDSIESRTSKISLAPAITNYFENNE